MSDSILYRVLTAAEWQEVRSADAFIGSALDQRDGFIHLSSREQVAATIAAHFANRPDLVILAIDAGVLEHAVRWEVSRSGALFPHLYGKLPLSAVVRTLGPDAFTRTS